MTPEQAAHDTAATISNLPGAWMTDPATYAHGASLGFEGMDFYVAGRGGVLGDVDADVVTAAFVYFAPATVRAAWERSAAVMSRADAAQAFAGSAHTWAREHLQGDVDWPRLAALLGRVVAGASVSAAPLFAGWRALPEPDVDPKGLAFHRMNALRELRGALHACAVLTVGLAPEEAVAARTPFMFPIFGWEGEAPDAAPLQERWALAEARTDRMTGRHYGVLDEAERTELVELLGNVRA